MNAFNRIAMLLLSIAALAFGTIGLLLLGGLIHPAAVSPNGVFLRQWGFFTQLNGPDATTAAIVCAILVFVGLILLIFEILALIPRRREPAQFVVRQDGLGSVTVARSSVRDLVQYEAATVPGVVETREAVVGGSKELRVYVRTTLSPEAEAPQVGKQLQEKLQLALQRQLGLPVTEVRVSTQLVPFEQRAQRRVS
jgi:uncharacterized alkaline shock family protein YloU